MAVNFRIMIFALTVFLSISHSTAWWWGSAEPSTPSPHPPHPFQGRIYAMYHPRFMPQTQPPTPPPTPAPAPETVPVPAIPIQVPLKAQLAPHANMQNVQLVRCLCPVMPDMHMEKDVYAQPVNNIAPTNVEV